MPKMFNRVIEGSGRGESFSKSQPKMNLKIFHPKNQDGMSLDDNGKHRTLKYIYHSNDGNVLSNILFKLFLTSTLKPWPHLQQPIPYYSCRNGKEYSKHI
jgi:hypothetical protein